MRVATHSVTGAQFPGTCYGIRLGRLKLPRGPLCQPANPCLTPFQRNLCNAIFAMQSLLRNLCYAISSGPPSGPPLPTSKSLPNPLSTQFLQCNLCNAIFATQSLLCNLIGAPIGAPFANQQILEFLATQSLLLLQFLYVFPFSKFIFILMIFLCTLFTNRSLWTIFQISLIFWISYHRGPLCQPANP